MRTQLHLQVEMEQLTRNMNTYSTHSNHEVHQKYLLYATVIFQTDNRSWHYFQQILIY